MMAAGLNLEIDYQFKSLKMLIFHFKLLFSNSKEGCGSRFKEDFDEN